MMSSIGGETTRTFFCSRHWDSASYRLVFYKFGVFLCVILAITVTLGNSLILFALRKNTSLHPPSKILLRSLAIADFFVGIISMPFAITLVLSGVYESWNICRITEHWAFVATTIFSGVSLETLTAISVDRLLALLLKLRYRQVVTVKRVRAAVCLFWLQNIVVGLLFLWDITAYFIASGVLITLQVMISTYSYTRIFRLIRRQQKQVQDALGVQRTGNSANMAQYKRTVVNVLWVHLTLAICYLPFAVVTVVINIRGFSSSLVMVWGLASIHVYLHSLFNPILYCWKIKEVRQAVKETMRHVCPPSST